MKEAALIVYARINQAGWVHLWDSREAFEAGEASLHFCNARIDPRWTGLALDPEQRAKLAAGELVPVEDPGYLDD
jgi:hypothetical protein